MLLALTQLSGLSYYCRFSKFGQFCAKLPGRLARGLTVVQKLCHIGIQISNLRRSFGPWYATEVIGIPLMA